MLPKEVWRLILVFSPSLSSLCRVNKQLSTLSTDDTIWYDKLLILGYLPIKYELQTWKERFMQLGHWITVDTTLTWSNNEQGRTILRIQHPAIDAAYLPCIRAVLYLTVDGRLWTDAGLVDTGVFAIFSCADCIVVDKRSSIVFYHDRGASHVPWNSEPLLGMYRRIIYWSDHESFYMRELGKDVSSVYFIGRRISRVALFWDDSWGWWSQNTQHCVLLDEQGSCHILKNGIHNRLHCPHTLSEIATLYDSIVLGLCNGSVYKLCNDEVEPIDVSSYIFSLHCVDYNRVRAVSTHSSYTISRDQVYPSTQIKRIHRRAVDFTAYTVSIA
jgi:hypothetical protein